MRYAGIDYDIQAIDITDPNPIALLLLCTHLYQRLPQYLPKATVEFSGPLHHTVSRQVTICMKITIIKLTSVNLVSNSPNLVDFESVISLLQLIEKHGTVMKLLLVENGYPFIFKLLLRNFLSFISFLEL
jgi:hypothetical protein